MVDTRKIVINALEQLELPVLHEHFLTKQSELPCITYRPGEDVQGLTGKELMYSNIHYNIKVWAKSIKDLTEISNKIDKVMRSIGFTRTSTTESWAGEIGQYELRYKAKALEIMEV